MPEGDTVYALTLHTHLRMSGSWTVSAQGRWLPRKVMPDVRVVLRDDWDAAEAARRMAEQPERPHIAALLDQRCVAGFGNLWANELCYLRGHSPWTPTRDVDIGALLALGARALRHSATVPGAMQVTTGLRRRGEQHWVAGRAHRPCLRCGTRVCVVAEVPNDPERRRTWWCPTCQPGPPPDRP